MSTVENKVSKGRITAWALWDWASAAFNAVVTTFVFSVYITNADLFGDTANSSLGRTLTVSGIIVAIIAPALGQATDRSGRRRFVIALTTTITIIATGCLAFVRPDEAYLWLGLLLLAAGNITFETGSVVYNAMISDIATEKTVGKISGLGWGLGYVGGIVLLIILYVGFIAPEVGWFGVTSEDAMNIRTAMVVCAVWTLIFSLPLMLTARDVEPSKEGKLGIIGSYKEVIASIKTLWKKDRSLVWFLLSSAVYRDGLAGVFTFGGVLAGAAFGFEDGDVLIFGIVANLVAGIATISFGYLDDKFGARLVILWSLLSMVILGLIVFTFHSQGKIIFWIFGLALCVFVGPVQSASRTYLARFIPKGDEAEIFGLYATTGRAASPLAPFFYGTAISLGASLAGTSEADAAHFGILGITIVLAVGLLLFFLVRPAKAKPTELSETPVN